MNVALPIAPAAVEELVECTALRTEKELRVLQVFSVLSVGGAETWMMALLRHFREAQRRLPAGVKVDILLTGGEKAVFDDEAIALGSKLFYVPFTRSNAWGFVSEFRRILRDGNYDAIHDHQDYIAGVHFLMGLGQLPPIRIAHVHNPLYQRDHYTNGSFRRMTTALGKRLLGRLATHIMGTSRQIVSEYGFDGSTFRNVALGAAQCGFDLRRYEGDRSRAHADLCNELGWPGSSRVILFVGRLESPEVFHLGRMMTHKNPEFALDVVRECIAKDSTVRFAMVGEGATKKAKLEEKVAKSGLADRVRLLGVRHDVPRLMLGSDLLLFPSLAEGLGMVVVEAQAAGLRVLASDTTPRECTVVPEMIRFLTLTDPAGWADEALHLLNLNLDTSQCNAAVSRSPYSIRNSALRLLSIYGGSGLTHDQVTD